MLKVLVPVIIVSIIAVSAWVLSFMFIRAQRAPRPTGKEKRLQELSDEANKIFNHMFIVRDVNNVDILTEETKSFISEWQKNYRKVNR